MEAKANNISELVSFGGAYSNHIHALAVAAKYYGFKTHGIIRGEYDPHNPTIQDVIAAGMKLEFVTRLEYKQRHDQDYLAKIAQRFPDALIIPEGGTCPSALTGVAEIMQELAPHNVDYICTPCGSGGTTAGLLSAQHSNTDIISIPVLKKAAYLKQQIIDLVDKPALEQKLQFLEGYHFGGYGKFTPELLSFIEDFYQRFNIQLEPIYSAKMVYAVFDLIEQGHFPRGSHIVLLHTGGLQGLNGLIQRKLLPEQWINWHRNENTTNS